MTSTLSWGERIRTLRSRLHLDQDEMGGLLGLSREWVSKLERGNEEASERVRLKMEKLEREKGIRFNEPSFTPHLKTSHRETAVMEDEGDNYQSVASRLPRQRTPSTRQDCEAYVQQLMDAADLCDNPNAFPVIHDRLLKRFPLDEWETPKTEE